MNSVNGVSSAPQSLLSGHAAQLRIDEQRDGALDGVFASLLSFGGTTSARLHTQTMADAEQMFQSKGADGASGPESSLQEQLAKESNLTPTELGVTDESRLAANAGYSEGMTQRADAPSVAKSTLPGTNRLSANVSKHVAIEPLPSGRSRGGIPSPIREMRTGTAMPQKPAELGPFAANASETSFSFAAKLSPTPAMQVAEVLKGNATIEMTRSNGMAEGVNNGHAARSQSSSLPKAKGLQTQIRNGNASAQRPLDVETFKFDELVKSVRIQMGTKQSSARLRLQPPELGNLRVDVKVLGDRVRIDMQTETQAARDLLSRRAEQLRTGLENQGIRLERLDVVLNNSAVSTAAVSGRGLPELMPDGPARVTEVQRPRSTQRHEDRPSASQRTGRSAIFATDDERFDING